jgi:hypothetical protein
MALASPVVVHPPTPSAAANEEASTVRAEFTHDELTVVPVAAAWE